MRSSSWRRALAATGAAMCAAVAGCGETPIQQLSPPAIGTGPRVVWDLGHRPLPEIPLPNDIATRPDPTSPTGLRINASLLSPTRIESRFRGQFDELDGFGTYQAITVPFAAPLDLGNIVRRHHRDDFAFADDAVYLVDLETGLPQPLDLGDGNFPYTRRNREALFPNDPRATENNLIFDTVNEDRNGDGLLQPEEDSNFDGVMGVRSVFPASGTPTNNLTAYFDQSANVLILRPLVPLREQHHYAVVLTTRLVGNDGQSVRSPFDTIAHPLQAADLQVLREQLNRNSTLYGNLRWSDACPTSEPNCARVAFAWSYTTQTTVSEYFAVRDGLYGRGPFASLARITPRLALERSNLGASGACRPSQVQRAYVIDRESVQGLFATLDQIDDPGPARRAARDQSYSNLAYVVAGTYHSPYLTASDQRSIDYHAHWQINVRTGEMQHVGDAEIPFLLYIPRESATARQPFPTVMYTHGYGAGITESIGVAGVMAQNGIATIAIDGPTHGLPAYPDIVSAANTQLRSNCLEGLSTLLLRRANRSRDMNGDGFSDPAADFWTSYVTHSRDNVRQYALEISQLLRAMRGFGTGRMLGLPLLTSGMDPRTVQPVEIDGNGNGRTDDDVNGDYDGNGVPDVGGPNGRFYVMGESLGGIMSELLGGAEPELRGSVPFAGGGGLSDVGARSVQGGIKEAVLLRLMGPMIVGSPASDFAVRSGDRCTSDDNCPRFATCGAMGRCQFTRTACPTGQTSLRILATNIDEVGQLEFACAQPTSSDPVAAPMMDEADNAAPMIRPGDTVMVRVPRSGAGEEPVVRCARVSPDGRFQLPFPADTGDPIVFEVRYVPGQPDRAAVSSFGTCDLRPEARLRARVSRFHVFEGQCAEGCGHIPREPLRCSTSSNPDPDNCHTYRIVRAPRAGENPPPLQSPTEGLGLRRQSPEFRRFLTLAQSLLDPGDPISFAPYYFLRRPDAQFTQPQRHSVINVSTVGDQNVPLNTGNAFGRAAGLLPFLRSDAPAHLREYATPTALFGRYDATPNRVLIDNYVIEGIYWLERFPNARGGRDLLFDADNFDEGEQLFGEATLTPPLRLVRLARPMSSSAPGDLDAVWAPTTGDRWSPRVEAPLSATVNYYVRAQGHHSVDEPPRPDLPFDYTTYMYNLAARFFNTDGADIYYRSHPDNHRCLEDSTCPHHAVP